MNTYRPKMDRRLWLVQHGNSPIVACAMHDGHALRSEVAEIMALNEQEQLREENPYTGMWSTIAQTRIVGLRSRFEVNLNRPKQTAVYNNPSDAKDLKIWSRPPSKEVLFDLITEYNAFYAYLHQVLEAIESRFGHFVLLDIQSYNHRRAGPDEKRAPQALNPDVNIGTEIKNRKYWAPVIDGFIEDLRAFDFMGIHLDVRENVKFKGSYLSSWVNEQFPRTGCAFVVDIKKFFMDEWTGELFPEVHEALRQALLSTIGNLTERILAYSDHPA